jgi:glycosyltransferase involved in cell wall biosynthesis
MMPAYNAAPFIEQAIESLLAQAFADWELIVVDDGSTDETAEIATRFVKDLRQGKDQRIKVLRQANGGESCARNRALER